MSDKELKAAVHEAAEAGLFDDCNYNCNSCCNRDCYETEPCAACSMFDFDELDGQMSLDYI